MPPRGAPDRGRGRGGPPGGPGRGGPPRGGAPSRGGSAPRGRGGPPMGPRPGGPGGAPPSSLGNLPPSHLQTVGVVRPGWGRAGRQVKVLTNHFPITIPQDTIFHYDVVINNNENKFPARLNMDIITSLQKTVAPNIFTRPGAYDGRKNMFTAGALPFPDGATAAAFDVPLDNPDRPTAVTARGPKTYRVELRKVAELNPEVLHRYVGAQQSHDNTVLTVITALNVIVRMQPTQLYPFNVRSFFTEHEKQDIGGGIILWRGYFQSVRPSPQQMLVNIDISTGTMFQDGPLINVLLSVLGFRGGSTNEIRALGSTTKNGQLTPQNHSRLQRFMSGMRVQALGPDGKPIGNPRPVKRLTKEAASELTFELRGAGRMTVADYFKNHRNMSLRYPHVICVEVGAGALLPLEVCYVPKGQIMRRQVPPEATKDVLTFATRRPHERLQSIQNGLQVLKYADSPYLQSFGMTVDQSHGPLSVDARILDPPTLKYGTGSKQPNVRPRDGAWNMIEKKFYRPSPIVEWVICIFERPQRFGVEAAGEFVRGFLSACEAVGIVVSQKNPLIVHCNPQQSPTVQIVSAGSKIRDKTGKPPTLIVAILPEGATDLYTGIKHFGDVKAGVATQCLKASKCFRAKPQYFANVLLKVNVKLGGINTIPEPQSVAILTDRANPTLVLGADVIHPAPGSEGRPSFTALVGNIDSDTAKYVATLKVQTSRQEMIDDLQEMAEDILNKYMGYRKLVEKVANPAPKRILFYRDGVSEGQFQQVKDLELKRLKDACAKLKISPKISVIVVGKRHHVRFFPQNQQEADRSGNCIAGTVVDTQVAHPIEFDFYLQSHGGLLGTSRPSHYNVLFDENNFGADGLQSLSFALCHVYARSTRSVSIPAPVYYADIMCSRAKIHYDPDKARGLRFTESGDPSGDAPTEDQGLTALERYKQNFMPAHVNTSRNMFFS